MVQVEFEMQGINSTAKGKLCKDRARMQRSHIAWILFFRTAVDEVAREHERRMHASRS